MNTCQECGHPAQITVAGRHYCADCYQGERTVHVSVRLPERMKLAAHHAAVDQRVSLNTWIVEAVRGKLEG